MNLGIIKTRGIGASYLAAQLVESYKSIELLEVIPMGEGSLLIIQGDLSQMINFRKSMRTADLVRSCLIPDCPEELLQAFYNLNKPELGKGVIVFESDFIGDLFELGKSYINKGLRPFEFRHYRTAGSKSYLTLTGDISNMENGLDLLDRSGVMTNYIEQVTEPLKGVIEGQQISGPL